MNGALNLLVPLIFACVGIAACGRGTDVFAALTRGAERGLKTVADMFPALCVLFPAVYMLRASGALDALSNALAPALSAVGIPPETVPLALVRPLSGGAATALAAELISQHGADSFVGRCAAVMLGSSETTFYVIAVYFGAAKIKNSRWAVWAALCADMAVVLFSSLACRLLWA